MQWHPWNVENVKSVVSKHDISSVGKSICGGVLAIFFAAELPQNEMF